MKYLKNTVKTALKQKKAVFGSWINMPSLVSVDILARNGYEFLVIDREHTAIGLERMQEMIMVIESFGVIPFVRVSKNDASEIKKTLDAGAYGIIVPMVNSKDDVDALIDAVYYPPQGKRGVGLSRAQGYGMEFDTYKKWYLKNVALVAQIEHIDAINNLESILSSSLIDATMIGPYDLSASLGRPGDFTAPAVKNALRHYENVSIKMKKPFGYHIVHPNAQRLAQCVKSKYTFIVYGIDEIFLAQSSHTHAQDVKKILQKGKV
jgi:2-dehydro-3-deoxyglucarate aldolase